MALQWMILACVVAAEAAVAALLTLPAPRAVRGQIVGLTSMLLQPLAGVLPFAGFQLLDIYWKKEHRLMCTTEVCTAEERVHFEKAQGSISGCQKREEARINKLMHQLTIWSLNCVQKDIASSSFFIFLCSQSLNVSLCRFSKPRGMSFFAFQYSSSIGPFIVFARSTRILSHWRRLKSVSRKSKFILFSCGCSGIPGLRRCIQIVT